MKISIIIPVFNERDSINQLYAEIVSGINARDYEIIFIDDGSDDKSNEIIKTLSNKDSKIILIQFYKNYNFKITIRQKMITFLKTLHLRPNSVRQARTGTTRSSQT